MPWKVRDAMAEQDLHEASEERLNGHAAPPERPITPPAAIRRPADDKAER
jgi:hypothetical protein